MKKHFHIFWCLCTVLLPGCIGNRTASSAAKTLPAEQQFLRSHATYGIVIVAHPPIRRDYRSYSRTSQTPMPAVRRYRTITIGTQGEIAQDVYDETTIDLFLDLDRDGKVDTIVTRQFSGQQKGDTVSVPRMYQQFL